MKVLVSTLAAVLLFVTAVPESPAQWFGSKKSKTPPAQRVSELTALLKADKDSHKRMEAAEELRQFDPKEFPEIVPALADALLNDPVVSVRIEAVISLGRLRPISVPAGQALEKAASGDSNLRVRLQAKTSLTLYQLSGYHGGKTPDVASATKPRTDEPPLAGTVKDQGTTNAWFKNTGNGDKSGASMLLTGSTYNFHRPMPAGPANHGPAAADPTSSQTGPPPMGPSLPGTGASTIWPRTTEGGWVPTPPNDGPSLFPPK